MRHFVVSTDWIDAHTNRRGSWSFAQLKVLGIELPPRKGWKFRVNGKRISLEEKRQFELLSKEAQLSLDL